MPADQIWVLVTLVAAFVLLVGEWIPAGISGLLALASLLVANAVLPDPVLAGEGIFGGLTDKAVIAVAAMFVISQGIQRTGAIGLATDAVMSGRLPRTPAHYVGVLLVVMVMSAFMNNTPLVLIFLPVVLGLARRMGEAPSRLLMPLSFVSIMGGMCTLVGTSTNIIVASSLAAVSEGSMALGMFDFMPLGIPLAILGTVYLVLARRRLLPERLALDLGPGSGIAAEYMTEIEVEEGGRLASSTISEAAAKLSGEGSLRILQLVRNDVVHPALPDATLAVGDVLRIKGDPASLARVNRPGESGIITDDDSAPDPPERSARRVAVTLCEIIVPPSCRWLDRRVRDVRFGQRFGVSVHGVQRHGTHLRERVAELRLKAGDVLLVQGTATALAGLKSSDNFIVVEGVDKRIPHTRRAPIAILAVLLFMGTAMIWPADVHALALGAALIMVLGRCLTASEAYAAMNWDVLFLLGGMLALGRAFDQTGLAGETARLVVAACGDYGVTAAVGGIFVFTMLITQVLSNNAAAAIMTPLAFQTGTGFPGADGPLPFVMAVAFGASCCFLTPMGYQTNLLVYGPGGYRFVDFLRFGLPLAVLFSILATVLLPIIY